jgi:hypothetical protein
MGSKDDTLKTEAHERMGSLATTKMSAVKHKLKGNTEHGNNYTIDPNDVEALIKDWPKAPKKVAEKLLDHYGTPNEATPTKLFWYNNGPWQRTMLTSDEITHNFPTPHTDFLTQYIKYKVPPEKVSDLVIFDGSVLVDRTAGEMGVRCDHEAFNILTFNLAHDIINGEKTVDEARKFYAESAVAYVMGRDAPYVEKLLFNVPDGNTADPDERIDPGPMAHQTGEKARDLFRNTGE